MTARAVGVEATRNRILKAVVDLAATRRISEITLASIAGEAGVTVQTVLRQFGSRLGALEAAKAYGATRVRRDRATPVGDVVAALRVLVAHYEDGGRAALLMLAQELDDEFAATITAGGRAVHRAWVREVFAPYLATDAHDELVDLLVVATDVYAWKLLRLDRGLSRRRTLSLMTALVECVLGISPSLNPGGR